MQQESEFASGTVLGHTGSRVRGVWRGTGLNEREHSCVSGRVRVFPAAATCLQTAWAWHGWAQTTSPLEGNLLCVAPELLGRVH